jgi:hypothetical protein
MMKTTFKFVAIFLAASPSLLAQAAPGATAGSADLHYAFRYSQNAQFGGDLGDWQTVTPSAELDYSNGRDRHLFSLTYSGGYTSTVRGPSYGDGMFQRLLLSQGIAWRKWNLLISDNVSYLPQAPLTGFTGIPGIGEPIGVPGPGGPSSQSILTVSTHAVDNTANGALNHILNFATSLSLGGSSDLLRYPDGNGINTDSQMANGGLTFRLNARNSLSGQYHFSQFSYPDYNYTFMTNSGMFGFQRTWSRSLTTSFSAGPEWTGGPNSKAVPSSTGVSAQASLIYHARSVSAGANYNRSTTGGSGYLLGAESDSVTATLSREFERTLTLGLTGGYNRTSGLGIATTIESEFGAVQASRQLGRYLSVFASYTATTQSSTGALPANVLNQFLQGASFGIAYSRETNPTH